MPRIRLDGGVIGSLNTPTTSVASGIWTIKDNEEYTRRNLWPSQSNPVGSVNAIVAMIGGGAGATGGVSSVNYGAGGAGGVLRYANSVIISGGGSNYTVVVGAGGAGIATGTPSSGSNSTFGTSSVIATGGNGASSSSTIGGSNADYAGGTGSGTYGAGGGAGAAGNGGASNAGGPGANIAISGTFVSYGGGGAGKSSPSAATGGIGGGGNSDTSAANNTGGGAGGTGAGSFYNGGSGIVIINYPAPQYFTGGVVTNVTNNNGANVVHTFKTSSTLTALATPIDTYQPYNSLLLHADGTNGANNNVFVDSSSLNTSVTRGGTPTQGTFSPFSTTGWSNYFTSTSDTFTSAVSSNFAFAGTFTIEFWIYLNSVPTTNVQLVGIASVGGISVYYNSGGFISANLNGTGDIFASTYTFTGNLNTWHHVVLSRGSGNTMRIWVDGVSYGSGTSATSFTATTGFKEGGSIAGAYISNLRVNNTDVYGVTNSIITVPSIPLSAITGTQLLINQSNRYIDNSTNNLALTIAGSPQVQSFSPFNPTTVYSNSVGGSIYFNQSTDYVNSAINASYTSNYGDYTAEYWVYMTSGSRGDHFYLAGGTTRIVIYYTGAVWAYLENSTSRISSANNNSLYSWHHIALSRASNTVSMYVDGNRIGTYASTYNLSDANYYIINGKDSAGSTFMGGYLSNVRFVNGTALYSGASITVPTAPFTSTPATYLLSANNAGIIDSSQKNDFITYGTAAISTTQSKFGGTSMYFDGSTGYLSNPSSTAFTFGPGDFTVEYWVYYNAISGSSYQQICGGSSTSAGFSFGLSSTAKLYMTTFSVGYTSTGTTLVTGQWYHVAFVRKSGTVYFYLNGVLDYSVSAATTITETGFGIGGGKTGVNFSSCYVDELRVTQGYARYTSNFTPQTSAFLDT